MNQNWIWKISIINFANRGEKTKTTARIFNQKYCWATARNCTDAVLSTPLTSWRCTENYSQGIISTKNYVLQLSTAQALKQVFFPLSLSHSCSVVLSHSLNMGGGEKRMYAYEHCLITWPLSCQYSPVVTVSILFLLMFL